MLHRRSAFSIFNFQFSISATLTLVACLHCTRAEHKKPSVLLITLDTFRADHLSSAPHLTALAARGVRFDEAISAVPLTLPSHATILSGVLPLHHGLRNNGAGAFPANRETLATRFNANGYRTAAFVGAFVLDHRFGLNRGFEVYDDDIPRDPTLGDHLEAERRGDAVVDRALAWLRGGDARPYFAWVHLYDAHAPYAPPPPYQGYDGEIAFVDAQVQRLLDVIGDDTIVIVTGDHGEALGEHGELTHGLLLYEPTLRVPLIVAGGGLAPRVVRTPVSLTDVAPTVAALAGLSLASTDGRDLALRDARDIAQKDIYSETEYPAIFGWSGLAALRNGAFKYIASPQPELYDLARDPHEARNVYADERRTMRGLSASLDTLRATTKTSAPTTVDAETLAKLASLGYVGGAPPARATLANPVAMAPLFRKFEEATWATTAKKYDEAAATLAELVAKDPQNPVFRGSLAKVERQRGRPDRAVTLYREAVAFAPEDPEGWYNLASAFEESGDLRRAGEAVREAIRRDAGRPEAHNVLGIVLAAEGRQEEALAEFRKVVQADPRNARAYNNIGNALRALRRPQEAEEAYREAIALAATYPDPLNGLGALNIDRNRAADAVPFFDRALKIAPDYHEARLNRAVALQLSGDVPRAIADYREFVRATAHLPAFASQRNAAASMLARLETNPTR